MKLERIDINYMPEILAENSKTEPALQFDEKEGVMVWRWEINDEYGMVFSFDFSGVDIFLADKENSLTMIASEPWYVRAKTVAFANTIMDSIEESGSFEDLVFSLDNPRPQ